MALVVLLVVALAVALVGVAMADNVVRETQISQNESSAVQARYLAEAGIADAAAHLSQDNTWQGPVTQSLGPGAYTVQVDPNVSQLGALGAVKSVLSTGTISYRGLGSASQTVRVTLLVLPQAFSKPLVSNTVVIMNTLGANGAEPTVGDTVLRQLGAIHANNIPVTGKSPATTAVSEGTGTEIINQVTASQGTGNNATITLSGNCIACQPADNAPVIPFPTFNWNTYITLAQGNSPPAPCASGGPGFTTGDVGMFFPSEKAFHTCTNALTPVGGVITLTGVIFVNDSTLTLPSNTNEANLTINGTLAVYSTTASQCTTLHVCGNLIFAVPAKGATQRLVFTARGGEPAIMTGGGIVTGAANCNATASPGTITITGLTYILSGTSDVTAAVPPSPGYCLNGSSTTPVTLTGMLVSNVIGQGGAGFSSNSLTYDPSSFFPGLPSGLVTPTAPFVLLPLSWSSGN